MNRAKGVLLFWGRFDAAYPRNALIWRLAQTLGWDVESCCPLISGLGDLEARLRALPQPTVVWVPAFRQRDLAAAHRWARDKGVPLIFDPLISAYDKQVYERAKYAPESRAARRLLSWEQRLFALPDLVVADTPAHQRFFSEVLGVPEEKIALLWVGADEAYFTPTLPAPFDPAAGPELLFWGSFLPLHGIELLWEALCRYPASARPLRITLIGPFSGRVPAGICPQLRLSVLEPIPYEALASRIAQCHAALGIFGATPKAARVIPNKVFQALCAARTVITRASAAYPKALAAHPDSGLIWVEAGNSAELTATLARVATWDAAHFAAAGQAARRSFERFFSAIHLQRQLAAILEPFESS